jgi:hypothetical protein
MDAGKVLHLELAMQGLEEIASFPSIFGRFYPTAYRFSSTIASHRRFD